MVTPVVQCTCRRERPGPASDEGRAALTLEGLDWPLVLSVLEVSSRVSMSSDPIFSKLMVICWVSPLKSWMDTVLDSSSLDNGWGVWADLHRLVKKIMCSWIDWNEHRWVSLVNVHIQTTLGSNKYEYRFKFVKVKVSIIEGTFICFHLFWKGSSNVNHPEMCAKRQS